MRYVVGFVLLLALAAWPLSVSAQATGSEPEDPDSGALEWDLWAPQSATEEPAPEKPAEEPAAGKPTLQLKLDDAGVEVASSPLGTVDGYKLEEIELRVKRAKIGAGVSVAAMFAGIGVFFAGAAASFRVLSEEPPPSGANAAIGIGSVMMAGGFVGIIASSVLLRRNERELRELQEAHYETSRRLQWDPTRARLVF